MQLAHAQATMSSISFFWLAVIVSCYSIRKMKFWSLGEVQKDKNQIEIQLAIFFSSLLSSEFNGSWALRQNKLSRPSFARRSRNARETRAISKRSRLSSSKGLQEIIFCFSLVGDPPGWVNETDHVFCRKKRFLARKADDHFYSPILFIFVFFFRTTQTI